MTSACLPSKVLHLRHLPEECTEMDIRAMSAPFGYVRQVLFLSQKQQAFVEFSSIEEASMMLATCQTNVIRLGSRTLAAQFSNKQEITIPTRPLTDPSTVPECPPSKVLHLRNLPEECTELDIHTVSCPFGLIRQVLFLSRKQQAFVEFSTVEEATSMLVSSKAQPIRIGTRALIAQYSNKQVVTVPAGGVESADAGGGGSKPGGGGQGKILLITVTNVQFPVTLEVVYQVFGMCGAIAKAVVFNRQGKDQALVQYHRPQDAALAMSRFQGKNMYSGCNSLNIQYSKLPDVTVKVNNERACDFTHGPGLHTAAAFAAAANGGGLLSAGGLGLPGGMAAFAGGGGFAGGADFSGGAGGFPGVGAGFNGGAGGGFGGFAGGGGGGFDAFGMGGGGMAGMGGGGMAGMGGGGMAGFPGSGGGGGGQAGMGQGYPFPGAGGFGDPGPGFKRPYEAMGGYDGLDDGRRARPAGW